MLEASVWDISVGIKQRNKLFQTSTAKRSGKSSDRTKYNHKRNQVVDMLRTSKQLFFNRLNTADSKIFWRTVRLLDHQNTSIPTLYDNGTEIESSETKANALNRYSIIALIMFPPLTTSNTEYTLMRSYTLKTALSIYFVQRIPSMTS